MENALSDARSVTAMFDEGPKADRAVDWLLNIGVRQGQIQQVAESVPGGAPPAETASEGASKQRRGLVGSLVGLVRAGDGAKSSANGMLGKGPRRVTITDISPPMHDTIVSILNDEGQVVADATHDMALHHMAAQVPEAEVRSDARRTDIAAAGDIRGLIGACLVDSDTGALLASEGNGKLDLDLIAMMNTKFMRIWRHTVDHLNMAEPLDEILLTLNTQIHLFRPMERHRSILLYVALEKGSCNLGMARIQIKNLESNLAI